MDDPRARRIRAAYPNLAIRQLRRVAGGQYNDAFVADGALIFRFPRFPAGVARLRAECALLAAIRPHLPLPVPEPRYTDFSSDQPGQAFAGYPLLPGEALRREQVAALRDPAVAAHLAAQLAAFLRALHRIPVAALPAATPVAWGAAAPDWRAACRDLFARIAGRVLPRLDAAVRERLRAGFAAFLADDANFAFPPTLIHGDFGAGNILWDPAGGEITAVIDFGAAGLGDPACDVAAFLTYGESFVARGLGAYPELAALLPRARFYGRTFALQEALYGVEHGDEAAFARGVAPYLGEKGDFGR